MRRLLLLLYLPLAVAAFQPISARILATPSNDGSVFVEEKYTFPSTVEDNLTVLSGKLGPRLSLWKGQVEGFGPHVCKNPYDVRIVVKSGELPSLILSYRCSSAKPVHADLLRTVYVLTFELPVSAGLMYLPEGYTLEFVTEKGRVEDARPDPTVMEENRVMWIGPVSSAETFYVRYSIPNIYYAPSISSALLHTLSEPRWLFLLTALAILVYASREKIKEKITEIVASNTEVSRE